MKINDHNGLFRPRYLCANCYMPVAYHGMGEGYSHEWGRWHIDNGYYCTEHQTQSADPFTNTDGIAVEFMFDTDYPLENIPKGVVVLINGVFEPHIVVKRREPIDEHVVYECEPITSFFNKRVKKSYGVFGMRHLNIIAQIR